MVVHDAGRILAGKGSLNVFVYGFLGLFTLAGLMTKFDRWHAKRVAVTVTL